MNLLSSAYTALQHRSDFLRLRGRIISLLLQRLAYKHLLILFGVFVLRSLNFLSNCCLNKFLGGNIERFRQVLYVRRHNCRKIYLVYWHIIVLYLQVFINNAIIRVEQPNHSHQLHLGYYKIHPAYH